MLKQVFQDGKANNRKALEMPDLYMTPAIPNRRFMGDVVRSRLHSHREIKDGEATTMMVQTFLVMSVETVMAVITERIRVHPNRASDIHLTLSTKTPPNDYNEWACVRKCAR